MIGWENYTLSLRANAFSMVVLNTTGKSAKIKARQIQKLKNTLSIWEKKYIIIGTKFDWMGELYIKSMS